MARVVVEIFGGNGQEMKPANYEFLSEDGLALSISSDTNVCKFIFGLAQAIYSFCLPIKGGNGHQLVPSLLL